LRCFHYPFIRETGKCGKYWTLTYWRQVRQQDLDRALIAAIKQNDTPAAIALLDQGANANATDKPYEPMTFKSLLADFWNRLKGKRQKENEGYDPALLLYVAESDEELIRALLEHGADPDAMQRSVANPSTLLHIACYYNHESLIRLLLEHHANPNIRDYEGYTPLMCTNNLECAQLLLVFGAKVSVKNHNNQTVLNGANGAIEDPELIGLLKQALKKEQAE
jgi:ankyrin repeat protein